MNRTHKHKHVWDCFLFSNELDILEIRLATLYDHVDQFVLVEAPMSIAGHEKIMHYQANRERFVTWSDKIKHVVLDDLPQGHGAHFWNLRESAMRNGISRALINANHDDVVVISDADEIIHPRCLEDWKPTMGVGCPEALMSYYWFNCIGSTGWAGSRITTAQAVKSTSPDYLRRFGHSQSMSNALMYEGKRLGGWHFSWLGPNDAIRYKLNTWLHQELNLPHYSDDVWLRVAVNAGLDLFRRDGFYQFVPLDDRFPAYLVEHADKFQHLHRDGCGFTERMVTHQQLCHLCDTARHRSRHIQGHDIELGCWEGLSSVVIANARYPDPLMCVDTWKGSVSEGIHHPTVTISKQRDVQLQFIRNTSRLTHGNVIPVQQDHLAFLQALQNQKQPVRFAYIDGAHDYLSVFQQIRTLLDLVPVGGTICGDDFINAGASRHDLQGGVERAVRELLPNFEQLHNFWIWSRQS